MDNYPPGAANDPKAPWNQRDCDYWHQEEESGHCEYCDKEDVPVDKDRTCEDCFYSHRESW